MPTANRVARFSFQKGSTAKTGTLTVSVPTKLKEADFGAINKSVFDRLGKLTGHRGCLSGGIQVIFEEDFSDSMQF